jgi:Fibronectin type III domain
MKLLLAFLLCAVPAFAQTQATLTWGPSPSEGIAGYKVYIGTAPRTYGVPITLGLTLDYNVSGLTPGVVYYFAVTAFDMDGNESDYSNEVSKLIPSTATRPLPPTNLRTN